MFIFNYRVAQATYVVTLARNGPLPEPSFAKRIREPPAVRRRRAIRFPAGEGLAGKPAGTLRGKGRPYTVSIRILMATTRCDDETRTSTLDQTIMPGKPLVVGPVYTPNPDVFSADGRWIWGGCPAA
ncbi:MAG: hypothetical protein U5N27_19085 [Rhizobium sp.]|nr:hypothetical protein [Rhizobium sp.]